MLREHEEVSNSNNMSHRDYKRFSEFIYNEVGIKLPPSKKVMLESRIRKRLRELGLKNFSQYCNYVFDTQGAKDEIIHMIDVITTNKTDFFREPAHFSYLLEVALPTLINYKKTIYKKITLWSAGCSTGEEPYTLAMVLSEFAEKYNGFQFSILATDICTKVLEKAVRGTYEMEKVEPVPMSLKKKYLLRNKDSKKNLVRIIPELRNLIQFQRLNLMDNDFNMREPVDIIFCRNVIIYFDRQTQEKLINRFYHKISPGGYLFMGHSETLHGMNVPVVQVAPTIYRKFL
jgi:chemotaxis protein methyltransferase CheR